MNETTCCKPKLFIDAEEYPYVKVHQQNRTRLICENSRYDREVGMIPKYGLHFILNLRNPRTT